MPKPNPNETEKNYISRCIPTVLKEGTAKDNKQAAAICYSMWRQHKEKADLTEFSLTIRSVGLNKKTGERYWKASTSDIFPDSYNDEMSLPLYQSFLSKIEGGEKPPEQYRSDTWDGGMPYISVSHFREHSIAGDTNKVYVDGAVLKANGTFRDTPLGRACFEALCDDLYTKKSEEADRIRVSIAFLDHQHQHKSNGYIFNRSETTEVCPECEKERELIERPGRIFMDGLLIHFAMTRVPVNGRTLMEVERSMTTRKEDAASIIGEVLAEELESKERSLVSKADLVIKSEEDPQVDKSDTEMADGMGMEWRPFGGATSLTDAKSWAEASKEQQRVGDIWYAFQNVLSNIMRSDMEMDDKAKKIKECSDEFKSMVGNKNAAIFESLATMDLSATVEGDSEAVEETTPAPVDEKPDPFQPVLSKIDELSKSVAEALEKIGSTTVSLSTSTIHPLDTAITQLKSDYDSISLMDGTSEDKLREIQVSFNGLGEVIRQSMTVPEKDPVVVDTTNTDAILNAIQKLNDRIDLISSQQKSLVAPMTPTSVPAPRSIAPARVQQIQQQQAPKPTGSTPFLRSIIDRSVGLEG